MTAVLGLIELFYQQHSEGGLRLVKHFNDLRQLNDGLLQLSFGITVTGGSATRDKTFHLYGDLENNTYDYVRIMWGTSSTVARIVTFVKMSTLSTADYASTGEEKCIMHAIVILMKPAAEEQLMPFPFAEYTWDWCASTDNNKRLNIVSINVNQLLDKVWCFPVGISKMRVNKFVSTDRMYVIERHLLHRVGVEPSPNLIGYCNAAENVVNFLQTNQTSRGMLPQKDQILREEVGEGEGAGGDM